MANLTSSVSNLLSRLSKIFTPQASKNLTGSRSVAYGAHLLRESGLEISEYPIRDAVKARELIEMREYCYEVRHCLSMAKQDAFSSTDGDDVGYAIADTLEDGSRINADTKAIALDVITRKESHESYLCGGLKLQKALELVLAYGDCFGSLAIEKEGIGRDDYGISRMMYLPTWKIFRIEDNQGNLQRFEQRRRLNQDPPEYVFLPPQIVHWRHEPQGLYGRSLFDASIYAWQNLQAATRNLAIAAENLSMNPNLHILPLETTPEQRQIYQSQYEAAQRSGTITDVYLYASMDIKKISNVNPSLEPLIKAMQQWQYRMIPAGFPTYLFPNLMQSQEISLEPSRKYCRLRNSWCALLSEGLRQIIDTEIILRKGFDWFKENGRYRVIWSRWMVDERGDWDESATPGIADLD